MKKALLSIACFIAASLIGFEADPIEVEKIRLIAERYEKGQGEAWSNYSWQEAPLLVTFENGHMYAIGLKSSRSAWEKIRVGTYTLLFAKEDHLNVAGIPMQPWFEIEGKEAFLYQMGQGKNALKDVAVLAHERFHRYQIEHFAPPQKGGESRDHLNEENLVLSEIEDELIKSFLGAEKAKRLEILRDLAALLDLRRKAVAEETKEWENHQLKMEGLADYTASKLFGGGAFLLTMQPTDAEDEFVDQAIKWRHYLAGAALGYALDELGLIGWQGRVERGEELVDLFTRALSLGEKEKEQRVFRVKNRLGYEEKKKSVAFRLKQYGDELEELYKSYESSSGIKLFLDRPPVSISGGGANDKLVYLGDGSTVGIRDQSVATTQDGFWKFETRNVSHLFQHRNGMREVKLAKEAKVTIDKVSFSLSDLAKGKGEYPFHSLEIECDDVSLHSTKHAGVLVYDGKKLEVRYTRE